jgi:hypothetical protein
MGNKSILQLMFLNAGRYQKQAPDLPSQKAREPTPDAPNWIWAKILPSPEPNPILPPVMPSIFPSPVLKIFWSIQISSCCFIVFYIFCYSSIRNLSD